MTGSLSTSFQSMPTWAKWLLGVLVVGGLGAIAWAFLHKPSSREHRRQARSAEQASRRARQRAKKHHAAAKRARREEKRRK
jgi:hypothetical protein